MTPKVQTLGAPVARERHDGTQIKISTFIPLKIRKRGGRKVVVRPDGQVDATRQATTEIDQPLLVALSRAFFWQQLLDDGVADSGSEIAQREGLHHSTVNELLRLTLLELAIIQSILAGQQARKKRACLALVKGLGLQGQRGRQCHGLGLRQPISCVAKAQPPIDQGQGANAVGIQPDIQLMRHACRLPAQPRWLGL